MICDWDTRSLGIAVIVAMRMATAMTYFFTHAVDFFVAGVTVATVSSLLVVVGLTCRDIDAGSVVATNRRVLTPIHLFACAFTREVARFAFAGV
jgi:uncharacterized membrane protein